MRYLIGMDEAGYGPNLGPLVISATVWRVADARAPVDLYTVLGEAVTRTAVADDPRIAIADSKRLYKPGSGLLHLERGLLPLLEAHGHEVSDWSAIWDVLGADAAGRRHRLPWYAGYQCPLPLDLDAGEQSRLVPMMRRCCQAAGVTLETVRSVAVFPEQFNALVAERGAKSTVLSSQAIALLAKLIGQCPGAPVLAICDKHGGRNRYRGLLEEQFPERFIEVRGESRASSTYCWGPPDSRVEVRFCMGGESFLPAALASMASKYLRELCMRALNAFWRDHVAGLRKTAGYPVDAKRFKAEIASRQAELGIDDRLLWRVR